MEPIYALAFDIERSGAASHTGEIIGLGASVVGPDFIEVDRLFCPAYHPGQTMFEPRCKAEFWDKNPEALEILKYSGPLTPEENRADMIMKFQAFRGKWEVLIEAKGAKLVLCSDNNVYDGGFVNELLMRHMQSQLPIPYSAAKGEYSPFWETFSQQRGLLMAVDPDFVSDWGLSRRIAELFDLPKKAKALMPHHPTDDAYEIAYDQQVLHGIRARNIGRRQNYM